MRHPIALALIASLAAPAALAQTPDPDGDGGGLMKRGVELFFEGLREEMSPAMESLRALVEQYGPSMQSFLQEMGPALSEMMTEVKDWTDYHPPEMLPNGDIILRKKTPKAVPDPETAPEDAPVPVPPSGATDI